MTTTTTATNNTITTTTTTMEYITIIDDSDIEPELQQENDEPELQQEDTDNYNYINEFINNIFYNPKTPYELFTRRLNIFKYTQPYNTKLNDSQINYLTLENLIIANIIRFELINRPIKLKDNEFYVIETDQNYREYSLFKKSDTTTTNKYISQYRGNNQDTINYGKHGRYTLDTINKMKREYTELINKPFIYKTINNKQEHSEYFNDTGYQLTFQQYDQLFDDDGNLITSDNKEDKNYPRNYKSQTPHRVFTVVPTLDSDKILYYIKQNLHSTDENIFKLYKLYVYYFYIAYIPLDVYYRYVEYFPIHRYFTVDRLRNRGYLGEKIKNYNTLEDRDFIIDYDLKDYDIKNEFDKYSKYIDNINNFYYFAHPRASYYKNSIKQIIYKKITELSLLYSNINNNTFHSLVNNNVNNTTTNNDNEGWINRNTIRQQRQKPLTKFKVITNKKDISELNRDIYIVNVSYDKFYVNELYNYLFHKDFPYDELFEYEKLQWLPSSTSIYGKNHVDYYRELQNNVQRNIDNEFRLTDSSSDSSEHSSSSSDNEHSSSDNDVSEQLPVDNDQKYNTVIEPNDPSSSSIIIIIDSDNDTGDEINDKFDDDNTSTIGFKRNYNQLTSKEYIIDDEQYSNEKYYFDENYYPVLKKSAYSNDDDYDDSVNNNRDTFNNIGSVKVKSIIELKDETSEEYDGSSE